MRELCNAVHKFRLLFMLGVAMVAMSVIWLPFVSPGTATYVVTWMTVVSGVGFAALSGTFIVLCRRRKEWLREAEEEEYRKLS